MSNIVISYARQDRTAVEHLEKDLQLMGHDVWVDKKITGGADWWREVLEHIKACDVLILALSSESLASDACRRESYYAHRLNRAILPVEVTQTVSRQLLPLDLHQLQVVAYLQETKEEFAEISLAIQRAPRKSLPNPLPPPPAAPTSYLMRTQDRLQDVKRMSVAEQDMTVEWLERGMRRGDEEREARALLLRMQTRRDLDPTVAERIQRALLVSNVPPPTQQSPKPLTINPPSTSTPIQMWRAPMYTFLILLSLLIPLVGLIVGITNVRFKQRRGQAVSLLVVSILAGIVFFAIVSSAEST